MELTCPECGALTTTLHGWVVRVSADPSEPVDMRCPCCGHMLTREDIDNQMKEE